MSQTRTIELATPTDRDIVITRAFPAPRALVFDALTNPDLLPRWFNGPPGWTLAVCTLDLRPGGAYRYVWRGPAGEEMGMGGNFREVVPPIRVSATEKFDQAWYPGEAIVTTELAESGGVTTLTLTARYESREARDAVLRSPMDQGVEATYNSLEAFLSRRDLVLTRIFNAPVELVWRAWNVSEYLHRWWGPAQFTCPLAVMDVRVGGTSIVGMRAPAECGGGDTYSSWTYTRIVPHQLLEFTQNLCDVQGRALDPASLGLPPDFPRDQRNLVVFRSLGAQTEVTVTQFDWTPGPMFGFAEMGWTQSLDKLAESLKS
jgi:uncharacterized protein YndB with AHSA1/START domain